MSSFDSYTVSFTNSSSSSFSSSPLVWRATLRTLDSGAEKRGVDAKNRRVVGAGDVVVVMSKGYKELSTASRAVTAIALATGAVR